MSLQSLANDLRNLLGRGVVRLVSEALKMRGLQVVVLDGELIDPVEHSEPYGFSAAPQAGAEAFLAFLDGDRSHAVALIVADRRYRPVDLQPGEAVVYDDQGQEIRITRSGIVIKGAGLPIIVTDTPKVTLESPQVEASGDLRVGGNILAVGNIADQGGGCTMADMRAVYDSHTHQDSVGGTTSVPNQQAGG